ncbi:hypothetical protein PRUB_b0326 [Pseudoalteromonas rubra]|uniref:DUF4291 domain-containing protein n=1 Tax=Pseudoalteromonas rubra TaxID=43658 RepID=A0A8T0BYT1_9GAMM|nr:DUF4291 domain-containing protein [Pseudoalteromonas rubra]KAF7781183.1 hypothetical protein PRUB_b0326 [Pseudoalteromonas rubra]
MVKNNIRCDSYQAQLARWPKEGKVILAQHDEESVTVYQAYNQSIGQYAAKHQTFGGDFSFTRMTWIKPNFLWMMYRSGWGTKVNQEVTLAVKIRRTAFDSILAHSVPSSFEQSQYQTRDEWKSAMAGSDVRLQWDPDHGPYGDKQARRAIQLGIKGETVQRYARDWILDISDISEFVNEQRENMKSGSLESLYTPTESVYVPEDESLIKKLGLAL